MKKNRNPSADVELRRHAEERLKRQKPEGGGPRPDAKTARLVHELQVHQLELEMQNEELRRAQQELERSREKYFDLYDLAPVGYLTVNEPGLILEANLTTARLLGVARVDLLHQPLTRFILREDWDIFDQHRRQLFETRAPQNCEFRLTRPGGAPFWVGGVAILAQDHDTAAPVCRVTLSDLTERKQAEADRERLAQFGRLAQLMKCANDSIVLTDEHGRILEANDCALETYGYSLAELRQKTLKDLRTPGSLVDSPQDTEQSETDGRAVFEAMHLRRDGSAFPVEISARFLQIAGVPHRLGIVRDITRRKRAGEAMRESEERFRRLSEAAFEGIAVHEGGVLLSANDQYFRMFGYEPDELLGKQVTPLTVAPDAREFMRTQIATGGFGPYESIGLRKDGTRFPMEIRVREMEYEGRKVRVGAVRDLTERKQAEERMRMFSQEIIDAREEERKQVASVLHHDVGSLAVGLSAHLDAIEEDLRSGKPGEALRWMKRTRKLFDESVVRLKKLAIELRPPELDVLGLSAALRQHFSHVTQHGGTRIHFRETLGRRRVSGDTATILFRVAQEALTNAITHGHATRVAVGLSASRKEVRLTVCNNGKAFDPSGRTAGSTSHMGLRAMQEMAAASGGTFTIDSVPGRRTTVRVRLPLK